MKFSDVYAEHDILGGTFINFNLDNLWNLYFCFGSFGKYTIINLYPKNTFIMDSSLVFKTGFVFTPTEKLSLFFDVSNVSLFEDGILGVFIFTSGANYQLQNGLIFGADFYVKWEDASVPFDSFNQISFRTSVGVRL